MNNFLFILVNMLLPIFIQISFAFLFVKVIKFNISPLAKIQIYILIPALMFVKVYGSKIDYRTIILVAIHTTLLFILLFVISIIVAKLMKFSKPQSAAFTNSVCLYNSGNFCIPLIQLLFNNSFALSVQFIIMTVQNILTNTFGIYISSSGKKSARQSIIEVLKVPMIYSVILAFLFKGLDIKIWQPIWISLDSLGNGLVPLALITLGAQLAQTKVSFKIPRVYASIILRLLISPVVAFLLVLLLKLKGIAAEVLIISSAAPTAVNSVLLAIEYDNEPEFASQAIFFSTVLSSVTVAAVIFLVSKLNLL